MSNFLDRKYDALNNIDPDRIYVENIRAFFGIPSILARLFCEMAVKQGYFVKKIAICCPNKDCERVIITVNRVAEIPEEISCLVCEANEASKYNFPIDEVERIEFYQLKKNSKA